MTVTHEDVEPDPESTVAATVAVRIPRGSEGDLTTDARRRIARVEGVESVAVEELRAIEPGLSATIATVAVAVEFEGRPGDLRDRLTARTAVEGVDRLEA